MKAKINGMELEGTPEEVVSFLNLYKVDKNIVNYNLKIEPKELDVNKVTSKLWESIGKNPYSVKFDSKGHIKLEN